MDTNFVNPWFLNILYIRNSDNASKISICLMLLKMNHFYTIYITKFQSFEYTDYLKISFKTLFNLLQVSLKRI